MATSKLTAIQVRHLQMLRNVGVVRPALTNTAPPGMHLATLEALGRRGLVSVEKRVENGWTLVVSFEITAAGRVALDGVT